MKSGLNQATWPTLREYIIAEVALAVAKIERRGPSAIRAAETQVSRMETAFRESLPPHPAAARAAYLDKVMPTEKEIGAVLKRVKKPK